MLSDPQQENDTPLIPDVLNKCITTGYRKVEKLASTVLSGSVNGYRMKFVLH